MQGIIHNRTSRCFGLQQDVAEVRTPDGEVLFSVTRWSKAGASTAARELAAAAGVRITGEVSGDPIPFPTKRIK